MKFLFPKMLSFIAPAPATITTTAEPFIKEILNEAANVIDERGWCKYKTEDEHGRVCTIGAIIVSVNELYGKEDELTRRTLRHLAVSEVRNLLGQRVGDWNDNLEFFGAFQVKRMLRRTAKQVRE